MKTRRELKKNISTKLIGIKDLSTVLLFCIFRHLENDH
jgi:hypothetical protein